MCCTGNVKGRVSHAAGRIAHLLMARWCVSEVFCKRQPELPLQGGGAGIMNSVTTKCCEHGGCAASIWGQVQLAAIAEVVWKPGRTWLTVTMRSDATRAPLRMLTAGPLMEAQLGYSHDSGSYLRTLSI